MNFEQYEYRIAYKRISPEDGTESWYYTQPKIYEGTGTLGTDFKRIHADELVTYTEIQKRQIEEWMSV